MVSRMRPNSDLVLPMLLLLLAALITSFVITTRMNPTLRMFLALCAGILALIGGLSLISWAWGVYAFRVYQINEARSWGQVQISKNLQGLDPKAIEIVDKFQSLKVEGLMGSTGRIEWSVRCPLGNVPLEAFQDFMKISYETRPYLWPIREHTKFKEQYEWKNAEWLLTNMTRALVTLGWAEDSTSNTPARLNFSYEQVCGEFGMEVVYPATTAEATT